ncbi:MAG: S1 RNA-binding domain-containing protein [Anaerolineae bacterium]|jgi:small subunit ribosomal protein S1
MEGSSELQSIPLNDREWWTSLDEGYWQALLRHGEVAPGSVPPVEVQEPLTGLESEPALSLGEHESRPPDAKGQSGLDEWQVAQDAMERGDIFRLKVCGANRGGLLVSWNGLQGFVPASHLQTMPRNLDLHGRMIELSNRIGDSVTVRLIEVDPTQKRLVFSERSAQSGSRPPLAILSALCPGDVCHGTVTNLTTFGAFVDLGGIEGLIHISELSWDRVQHPRDVLQPNQEVDVYVLGINPEEKRIALSLKRLRPDPWEDLELRFQVGELIQGTVTNVVNFGAFVRVEEGLEGLVHITELAEGTFMHPRNVVHEGDQVRVRILNIDSAEHRLGLSLRQASDA